MPGRILASISFTHCTAFATGARCTMSSATLHAPHALLLNLHAAHVLFNYNPKKQNRAHNPRKTRLRCSTHLWTVQKHCGCVLQQKSAFRSTADGAAARCERLVVRKRCRAQWTRPFLLGQATLFALATLAHKGVILVLFGADGHFTPSSRGTLGRGPDPTALNRKPRAGRGAHQVGSPSATLTHAAPASTRGRAYSTPSTPWNSSKKSVFSRVPVTCSTPCSCPTPRYA